MHLLGYEIGRTTVQRILDEDGIVPAPERRKHLPWATFLKAHWGAIAAMDFFNVEVLSLRGAVRYAVVRTHYSSTLILLVFPLVPILCIRRR
jgi:hypothetical protein